MRHQLVHPGTLTNRWSKKFRTLFNTKYAADYTHYENQDAKLIQTKNTYKTEGVLFLVRQPLQHLRTLGGVAGL